MIDPSPHHVRELAQTIRFGLKGYPQPDSEMALDSFVEQYSKLWAAAQEVVVSFVALNNGTIPDDLVDALAEALEISKPHSEQTANEALHSLREIATELRRNGLLANTAVSLSLIADNLEEQNQVLVGRLAAGEIAMARVEQLEEQLEALRAGLESLKGDEKVTIDGMKWKAERIVSYTVLNQRINAILDGISNPAKDSDA